MSRFLDRSIFQVDVDRVTTQLKASLEKHSKLRILEEVRHYYDIESIMLLKDILFGLSPGDEFTHAALVTDAK